MQERIKGWMVLISVMPPSRGESEPPRTRYWFQHANGLFQRSHALHRVLRAIQNISRCPDRLLVRLEHLFLKVRWSMLASGEARGVASLCKGAAEPYPAVGARLLKITWGACAYSS
jgi:hypothetical protein